MIRGGGDPGYVYGIKILIGILNSILKDEKK